MIRIYIEPIFDKENSIKNPFRAKNKLLLTPPQEHYLINVMRRKDGDVVLVFNEVEGEWSSFIEKKSLILEKKLRDTEQYTGKSLAVGCIKSHRLEILVEKATEIGIDRLFLLNTARSDRKTINLRRLNSIAIEATEQSGRIRPLRIVEPEIINSFLKKNTKKIAFLHPEGNSINQGCIVNKHIQNKAINSNQKNELEELTSSSAFNEDFLDKNPLNEGNFSENKDPCSLEAFDCLIIGPEGGFSASEVELMSDLSALSLGKNILRTETAAMIAAYLLVSSQF